MTGQVEEKSIEQFRTQLGLLYLLKYSFAALTVWAFVLGVAIFALRNCTYLNIEELLWGLASLPLALLPAAWLAARRLPAPNQVRAALDRHAQCGGLLMAGAEQSLGDWQGQLPEVHLPTLRWRSGRSLLLLSLGTAFLAAAYLLPSWAAQFGGGLLDVGKEAEKLSKQIDVLEKEKVLDQQRAGDMKANLEQVRKEARGKDPIKTLESLDHLQDLANKAAQQTAESATKKMEDLGRVEVFTKAMDKLASKMDKAQLAEAMNEMAALARKAADENEFLESGLDAETLEAIRNSTLTPEQAKKLMEALKNAKQGTKEKIGRLVKAKLLKPEDLEKCDKAGECDCEGLAAYLKENGAKSDLTDALAQSEEGGKGGVTRGPGPAKLNFGDESSEEGAKFKEEELPPSELQAMKKSQITNLTAGAPQPDKSRSGRSAGGALAGAQAGGGSATTQVVLPRHRGAVQRYFDRPAGSK
ncbi:MAG: hypothetical protein U0840_14470 [Gemmataceae bacterium]